MPEISPERRCKHFDICELEGTTDTNSGRYCILHLPRENKDSPEFDRIFRELVSKGHSNYRFIYLPANYALEGMTFSRLADFEDATFPNGLNLNRTHFQKGLKIVTAKRCQNIAIQNAIIEGSVEIRIGGNNHTFAAAGSKFHGTVSIELTLPSSADLRAEFAKRVVLRGYYQSLNFDGGLIDSLLDVANCQIQRILFGATKFGVMSQLDLSNSVIHGHGLRLIGSPTLPSNIRLDGAIIHGATFIKAEKGQPRPCIISEVNYPRFHGSVHFLGTDLSQCLLVGNDLTEMKFVNVAWGRRFGRRVLYDEVALRNGLTVSGIAAEISRSLFSQVIRRIHPSPMYGGVKEAYQILKQEYQKMGDNVRAGEFHYGEMEMKRREYGWPKRVLCPEFLYWAANGYGIAWQRALGVLLAVTAGFALLYMSEFNDLDFAVDTLKAGIPDKRQIAVIVSDFLNALHYSLQVTFLQKPSAEHSSRYFQWIQLAQTIIGPIQVALFALALRMRMKR